MEFEYGVIAEKQIPNGIRTGFQLYLPQNRPERVRMVTERSPMSHAGTDKQVQTVANPDADVLEEITGFPALDPKRGLLI
ncbi:uncharacterized protein N7506_001128 [Penicillium brevicompactum]|uniref:uncharacterized protein n=1 Tax=Penicillium brevicompactum TaxID=5074 RepID=UPI00253FE8AE|nr:uncharacterized protein N7506_001128 [Penicillium brevicompactum]KAJ5347875.1 hypothetical protein N7506_001128 [Penicillium brevicompactum]